jgi:hypothetical protein
MGGIVSAGVEGVKKPVGARLALHCLEPWFDPVPASGNDGAKMRHQTPPETAQVEAAPQAQAPELSPMEALPAMLKPHGRTVDESIEAGLLLLALKASVHHGEFGPSLERLGLEPRTVSRIMQSARRFHGLPQVRKHCFNEAMMFTLLPLDDTQLGELERTGCTGGLKLTDMAGMTVRELRQAVKAIKASADPGHAALLHKLKASDTPH